MPPAALSHALHWYNGDGLRMRARSFYSTFPSRVDNDYVWDQAAGLPVILQDVRMPVGGSATTTTYLYGLSLIAETDNAGTTHFYLGDGLGSTTQLVESDGDVANTYTYDVWGALRSTTGTTANQFDFTGEQADHKANRGLVYLRARHYDPALGRFLSRDPLPTGNRYAYVGNNPVNFTDPSGECRVEVVLRPGGSGGRGRANKLARKLHELIEMTSGGQAYFYHAYIVTADPITDEKTIAEGGPFGSQLFAYSGPFIAGGDSAISYHRNRKKTVYDDAGSCASINADLKRAADAITSLNFVYDSVYLNSNSAASELLESIGIIPDRPGGYAPAWGRNLIDALFIGSLEYGP